MFLNKCLIGEDEVAILYKGGLVKLKNGKFYSLRNCEFLPGGRLVIGIEESISENYRASRIKERKIVKGEVLLRESDIVFENTKLNPVSIQIQHENVHKEFEKENGNESYFVISLVLIAGLFVSLFKKLAGINKELNSGSCQIRHSHAMMRISDLESKMLRKKVIDGGKAVKQKLDERKKKSQDV